MKQTSCKDHIKLIIPSIIGVFLFMTPIKVSGDFTIPIAVLAGLIEEGLTNYLSLIMMIIIVVTGFFTIFFKFNPTSVFRSSQS